MYFLFALFMADYALTYYGIQIGAIFEGNPLWVFIMNQPMYLSFPVRLLYFALLGYLPMYIAKKHKDKCRPIFMKAYYLILTIANIGILTLHMNWIIER